jgi:hypothetical protein
MLGYENQRESVLHISHQNMCTVVDSRAEQTCHPLRVSSIHKIVTGIATTDL